MPWDTLNAWGVGQTLVPGIGTWVRIGECGNDGCRGWGRWGGYRRTWDVPKYNDLEVSDNICKTDLFNICVTTRENVREYRLPNAKIGCLNPGKKE